MKKKPISKILGVRIDLVDMDRLDTLVRQLKRGGVIVTRNGLINQGLRNLLLAHELPSRKV